MGFIKIHVFSVHFTEVVDSSSPRFGGAAIGFVDGIFCSARSDSLQNFCNSRTTPGDRVLWKLMNGGTRDICA